MPPGPGGQSEEVEKLVRAPGARVLDSAGEVLLLGRDGRARALADESAELARAVLSELLEPRSREELRAALSAQAGEAVEPGGPTDALIDLLLEQGLVRVAAPGSAPRIASGPRRARVVLGLTGAIGSASAPALVSALGARGYAVRVAMTRAAGRLVRARALEALTHAPVVRSLWSRDPACPVPHLDLASWADAVLICPASATTIARIARGDFSDVVAATALTTDAKVLVAPSMNPAMMAAPAVRRNLEQLRDDGFLIVLPGTGHEVAEPPSLRRARAGAAPHHDAVLDLLDAVLARDASPRQAASDRDDPAGLPTDADAWDAHYAASSAAPSWDAASPDRDLLAAFDALAPAPRLALDIGTGTGANAAAMAARGASVVAIDVAPAALARARERHPDAPVAWLADDVTRSRLAGGFDVALDRGCLHALPERSHDAYARAVARLLRPSGALLLKVDSRDAPARRATHRFDEARVRSLLSRDFELVRFARSRLLPGDEEGSAWLAVLVRRRLESSSAHATNGA